jgi:hypothetical protein
MSKRIVAGVALATGLFLAGGAATASAATTGGNPTPTPTNTCWQNCQPNPRPVAAPWSFDLQESSIGTATPTLVNRVDGSGVLAFQAWRNDDTLTNPFISRFFLGGNSITLRHPLIPAGDINVDLRSCTLTVEQHSRFAVINGTGIATGLRTRLFNPGHYTLNAMISLPFLGRGFHQVCPFQFVPFLRLQRILNGNLNLLPCTPTLVDFNVQGRANLVRTLPVVKPWAPTVNPTNGDTVSPTAPVTVAPTTS